MNILNSVRWRMIGREAILWAIVLALILGGYAAFTHRASTSVQVPSGNYRAVARSDSGLAQSLQASDFAGRAWDAALAGRFDEAGALAKQCLKTDPSHAQALYALGASQFADKQYSKAATNFAAAAAAGSDWRYRNAQAVAQAELHDWNGAKLTMLENFAAFPYTKVLDPTLCFGNDQALAETKKMADDFPDQAFAHYLFGVATALAQDASGGLAELTRATELDPAFAAAFLARSDLSHHYGDRDGAIQDLNAVMRLHPKLAGPWRSHAELKAADGNYTFAVLDFINAIKFSSQALFRSDTLVLLADTRLRTGEASGAMEALTAACVEAPWNGLPGCAGQDEWGSAPENRAVQIYCQALALTDASNSLGLFQKSADLAPRWPLARLGIAFESARLHNFASAAAANAAAVELEPKLALGWFWKSTALSQLGQEGESMAALQRAEALSLEWTSPCTNHAGREMARAEFAAAADRLTHWLRKFDNAGVLWMRAKSRAGLHDEDGALLDLGRSIALQDSAEARLERARIFMARHQKRDAILDYVAICRSDPSQDEATAEARKALGQMTKTCERCGGDGSLRRTIECPNCFGAGYLRIHRDSDGRVNRHDARNHCSTCGGLGTITESSPCPECHGLGVIF